MRSPRRGGFWHISASSRHKPSPAAGRAPLTPPSVPDLSPSPARGRAALTPPFVLIKNKKFIPNGRWCYGLSPPDGPRGARPERASERPAGVEDAGRVERRLDRLVDRQRRGSEL